MAYTLKDAREMLERALQHVAGSSDPELLDESILFACDEVWRETSVTQVTSEFDCTADQATVNLAASLTQFRPEFFLRAEAGLIDRGTWATATAYVVGDMVQGDGTPDSKLYKCSQAHTSSASDQPGDSGANSAVYWTQIAWQERDPLESIDMDTMARKLTGRSTGLYIAGQAIDEGKPSFISFESGSLAFVHPVPDKAYPLFITWKQRPTSAEVEIGTRSAAQITFNIPDDLLRGTIAWGAAAYHAVSDPVELGGNSRWQRFQQLLRSMAGATTRGARIARSDPSARLTSGYGIGGHYRHRYTR